MATQPTQDPVASESPRNLKFNAGKIDEFVTSTAHTYTDRFGVQHWTIAGIQYTATQVILSLGFITMDSFQAGATLTLPNQVLRDTSTGEYYRWDGVFPKVVPAGSTPADSGGVSIGAWLSVGDAVLRGQISDPDGAVKYPELQMARWRDEGDVRGWNVKMDGSTDDTVNLNLCISESRVVKFPEPNNGPCIISSTILIPDDTAIYGPGAGTVVIKCSSSMSPNTHAVSTVNYSTGVLSPNKNIKISDIGIDCNGVARGGGAGTSGVGLVINAVDTEIDAVTVSNSPKWNFFFTSGNPFADVGHAGENTAYSRNIRATRFMSIDPIGGDGAIVQGTQDSVFDDYTNIISASLAPSKIITDGGFQIIEGCSNLDVSNLKFYHNGAVTGGLLISSHVNKRFISDITVNGVYGDKLSSLLAIFNDTSVQPVGGNDWRTRRYNIKNLHLDYPVLNSGSTVMQSRLVDIQNMMDIQVEQCSVTIVKPDGSYSAPTCVINFGATTNATIDGVRVKGVPDVGATSYPVAKSRGWLNISDANSKNIRLRDIVVENFGYLNRIVSDATNGCIREIKGISAGGVFVDGGTKEVIVSLSAELDVSNAVVPANSTLGRFSSASIAMTNPNLQVRESSPQSMVGGQAIRSITAGGKQVSPGIYFDRQFVSGSDPTGINGKGSVTFRTSDSASGTWSVTAHHEDLGEYRPVVYARSTTSPAKAWNPVIDNDTFLGEPGNRWKGEYFATAPIVSSDGTMKSAPEAITDQLLDAADSMDIILYQWLDMIEIKGADKARWHFGHIAQQVRDAFLEHGVDGTRYGLLCYDEWEDEYQPIMALDGYDENGEELLREVGKLQIKKAGMEWGVRPDQCLWLLLAASRRRAKRAEDRLDKIEEILLRLEGQ